MPNLKEVKGRIESVTSTQQITKAMKMVAASKLRKAQDRIIQLRPYAGKLNEILKNVSSQDDSEYSNPYTVKREVEHVLLVPIAADKGLCGAFNSNVFKATISHFKSNYQQVKESGNLTILPLGKRAVDYFKKRDYQVNDDYWNIFSELHFETVREIPEFIMQAFKDEKFDRVDIIYNEFKNVATQNICRETFLPIEYEDEDGKEQQYNRDYIFEPSKVEILEDLIPKILKMQIFKALLESNAAEQGARMTAMDQATENAGELLKELRLTYNRTRQAAITKEILEIVGGAEALSES